MASTLLEKLDAEQRRILAAAGEIATDRGERAFLVGGSVRDLLLERVPDDIDIVVEGDGMAVAQALARSLGGELTRHHAFQTAMVTTPGQIRVDVATARDELYPKPGQLPQVVPGSLADDLKRRDFTINTMALALAAESWGEMIDPMSGSDDLQAGLIRVMHSLSFVDDPTRILRALRFSLRFGHEIEAATYGWLREAVAGGYLRDVSGDRVRKELRLAFGESPIDGPLRLQDDGVLEEIAEGLRADRVHLAGLQKEQAWFVTEAEQDASELPPNWLLVLTAMSCDLSPQGRWELVRRMRLSRDERRILLDAGAPWARVAARLQDEGDAANSVITALLDEVCSAALLVAASAPDRPHEVRTAIRRYLAELRHVVAEMDGDDLQRLGVAPGPEIGRLLADLRAARLDGAAGSAAEERTLVEGWLAAGAHE